MIPEYLITGLVVGITIDILVNDPPNRCHPVSWLGRLIEYFIPKLKDKKKSTIREKINGIISCGSSINGLERIELNEKTDTASELSSILP